MLDATVALPGRAVRVLAVHPEAPTTRAGFRRWRAQLATLRTLLLAADTTTIALGDFNAGTLQPPYEALLRTPFRDAHDLVGHARSRRRGGSRRRCRGWVPTFVARLDHLLVGAASRWSSSATWTPSVRITGRSSRPWRCSRDAT